MKPLHENRAGRLSHWLAEVVFRYPVFSCSIQLLLVLVCLGYTLTRLQLSTEKNDLISAEESYQRQFLQFKKDFKIHDNLFVLIESANRERNREFVERLAARLRAGGQFRDVYYRGGLKLMGPKALLFLPEETLAELRQHLHTHQAFFQTFSQATNLDTLFGLANQQFRLAAATVARGAPDPDLWGALLTLQRIVDRAGDCLESPERPLAPNLSTLFGDTQEEPRRDFYLTFDHGRIFVLVTQAKDLRQEKAAIKELRKCIAETRAEVAGINAEITGEVVLRQDEMEQARHDTEVAAVIALALTASIFICSCRGVLRPVMATVCLLIGICYTLGFATLTVGRLNILSITLVPILIGLAIDYGVHLIFRYEEEMRRGHSPRAAMDTALGFTGIGVITSALTIAGAFYFMVLTDFKGMQEMGVIAGSGVIVCLIPMLMLLPLLLVGRRPNLPSPRAAPFPLRQQISLMMSLQIPGHDQSVARRRQHRRAWIEQLFVRRPWLVLVCGALFTVFTVAGSFRAEFDHNLLNLQSRGLPAVRLQKQLIRAGSQSLLYCAVIADSLPQAVEWEQRVTQLPSVARVVSLVKYLTEDQERKLALIRNIKRELGAIPLPELDTQSVDLAKLDQRLFWLGAYLDRAIKTLQSRATNHAPQELLRSVRNSVNELQRLTASGTSSETGKLTAFQQALFASLHETISLVEQQDDHQRLQPEDVPAFLRDFFISPSGKFLLQVYPKEDVWQRDKQERFIRELRTVDPHVTGSPVQFYEYTSRLKEKVQKGAAYAAAVVVLLVFLHFRRLSSVLLVLLPLAFGFCWMLGLMGWLGIPFNPVNIVSLILVIGIGVTNGVHILNRFAEEPEPNILTKSTGKAVLVSGLNTVAGFASLLVAKHQGIASLGAVMAIGTAACVVASLAFLPAVLTLLCRNGWCPNQDWNRRR